MKAGERLTESVYMVVVELRQPISDLLNLPLSMFEGLLESKSWHEMIRRDGEKMEYFGRLAKSVMDTTASAGSAIVKTISRNG